MENKDIEAIAERIKNGKSNEVEFLLLTKPIEGCLISQETLSELMDFDIFCIDWQEFNKDPKYTVGNFGKIASINFLIQEPLIQVLGDIFVTLSAVMEARIETNINIYLPYSSELHVEYTKKIGVLTEEIGINDKKVILRKFDFASILDEVKKEFQELNISIETVNWISMFYCNANLICNNYCSSIYATCIENRKISTPILEENVEEIYNTVMNERNRQNLNNYVMSSLFSIENVKKDMTLLKLDNLPINLRKTYSSHALQLMSFIQQLTGNNFVESEGIVINLLSMGPTSKIISDAIQESYLNMLRVCTKSKAKPGVSSKDDITLLIMDRNLDYISPIYSPILNMNLSENEAFSRFDDGIIEFLDEFILISREKQALDGIDDILEDKNGEFNSNKAKSTNIQCETVLSNELDQTHIHEITNPIYLSIMLDPEKLQKDLIISQNYPILSYRFISALEDLQYLISSGKESFTESLKKDIINRIDTIMNIHPIYGHNSWMFLLLNLNQSYYTRKFWNEVSEICNNYDEKPNNRKIMVLSLIYKYLVIIQNDISSSSDYLNTKSPSTNTSSSSQTPIINQNQIEKEEEIMEKIVSTLLVIREKLLPDSITSISKKLQDLSLIPSLFNTNDLRLELSALLQILHYFLIPIFPLDLPSFNSIFVRNLRKKFTNSSFENISVNGQFDLKSHTLQYILKIISLAISCSSYEGPDCKFTSFNIKQILEYFSEEKLSIFDDIGRLEQKLASIRNARNLLKNKSFRNFQLSPFLPENNKNNKREFQTLSLVAQVSLYIIQTIFVEEKHISKDLLNNDLNMHTITSNYKESDLQSLRNQLKKKSKTLVINIIGNISMFEINEIERLSNKYQEYVKVIILTDHISSAVSFTNSLITSQINL